MKRTQIGTPASAGDGGDRLAQTVREACAGSHQRLTNTAIEWVTPEGRFDRAMELMWALDLDGIDPDRTCRPPEPHSPALR